MAPTPHYSPYIKRGDFVFTSGQLPLIDPINKTAAVGIQEQTRLVLNKIQRILSECNLEKHHIVKTTAFITNMDDWGAVNEVYAEFFGELKPARSIIPVSALHYGCMIELEAIACAVEP